VRELWLRRLTDWLLIALLHSNEPLDDLVIRAEQAMNARLSGTPTTRESQMQQQLDGLKEKVSELAHEVQEICRHLSNTRDVAVVPLQSRSRKSSTEVQVVAPQPSSPSTASTDAPSAPRVQAHRSKRCYYHLRHGASARQSRPPCLFDPDIPLTGA